jgi:hypothetical protein
MNHSPDTPLLDTVKVPSDLRNLAASQLRQLADELRAETISAVSVTGGHLGAGLGVVELTTAIHYVFNTPDDRLVWDVGHQCYPHKILTGRRDRIRTLRNALMGELVDVLGSAVILIDDNDTVIGRMDFPLEESGIVAALATRTAFCHPAIAIRRQFLLDMRGYLGGFASEDTDLWLRARRAGARLRNLPDTLLRYRIHADQATANRSGYAEVAAHWLRELLLKPSLYTLKGFVVALTKCFVSTWLPRSSRYQSRCLLRDDASK